MNHNLKVCKESAEEEYMETPISVLKYISALEDSVEEQQDAIKLALTAIKRLSSSQRIVNLDESIAYLESFVNQNNTQQ